MSSLAVFGAVMIIAAVIGRRVLRQRRPVPPAAPARSWPGEERERKEPSLILEHNGLGYCQVNRNGYLRHRVIELPHQKR